METNQLLNVLGLSFDMIGFVLMFLYGLPSGFRKSSDSIVQCESESDKKTRERSNCIIKTMANTGAVLIFIGFVIQIIASIFS